MVPTTLGRAAAEFANDLAVDRTFRFFLPQYYPLCGFNSPEMMLPAYKLSHKLTHQNLHCMPPVSPPSDSPSIKVSDPSTALPSAGLSAPALPVACPPKSSSTSMPASPASDAHRAATVGFADPPCCSPTTTTISFRGNSTAP